MENVQEKKVLQKIFWSGEEISTDYLSKYYENELDEIKRENLLLGQFVGEKYIFNTNVKKGLIALKKKIEEKNNTNYFLVSKTLKNVYSFKLKIFETGKDNLIAANLYLIEIIDDIRFKKPLKTFVAQYVDENNAEFLNKVKYIFNISIEEEFLERERIENETIIKPIIEIVPSVDEQIEKISKDFVEEIIEELEKSESEVAKKILKEFKDSLKKESDNSNKEADKQPNYKDLKKKLSAVIEKHIKREDLVIIVPKLADVIKKYNQAVENIKQVSASIDDIPDEIQKPKEEAKAKTDSGKKASSTKKASASKSASKGNSSSKSSKKKGGDGGGKKDKKKGKKKEDPWWKGAVALPKVEINTPSQKNDTKNPAIVAKNSTKENQKAKNGPNILTGNIPVLERGKVESNGKGKEQEAKEIKPEEKEPQFTEEELAYMKSFFNNEEEEIFTNSDILFAPEEVVANGNEHTYNEGESIEREK